MKLIGYLLQLSLKRQIIITIIVCSLLCFSFLFSLFGLYAYEMRYQTSENYKNYYFSTQNDIFNNILNFQSNYFYTFEDFLKNLCYQLQLFLATSNYFDNITFTDSFKIINASNDENENDTDQSRVLYYLDEKASTQNEIKEKTLKPAVIFLNYIKNLTIPYFGDVNMLEGIFFYLNSTKRLYSTDKNFMLKYKDYIFSNKTIDNFFHGLKSLISVFGSQVFNHYISGNIMSFDYFFDDELIEVYNQYKNDSNIKKILKYIPYVEYTYGRYWLINSDEESNEIYILFQASEKFVLNIFVQLMRLYEITTIVTSNPTGEVLNKINCYALILKKLLYLYKNNEISIEEMQKMNKSYYNEIMNGNNFLTIDKCILNSNKSKSINENILQYVFNENKSYFYVMVNSLNISYVQFSNDKTGNKFGISKYKYPDYYTVSSNRPRYMILSFFNVYSFLNFYTPSLFTSDKRVFLLEVLSFILITGWHIWIYFFVVLFFVGIRTVRQVADPLVKLKNSIENMSIKDDKIFEYKLDSKINDLFQVCKELVKYGKGQGNFKNQINNLSENNENLFGFDNNSNNGYNDMDDVNNLVNENFRKNNLITNNELMEEKEKEYKENSKFINDVDICLFEDINTNTIKARTKHQFKKKITKTERRLRSQTHKSQSKEEFLETTERKRDATFSNKNQLLNALKKKFEAFSAKKQLDDSKHNSNSTPPDTPQIQAKEKKVNFMKENSENNNAASSRNVNDNSSRRGAIFNGIGTIGTFGNASNKLNGNTENNENNEHNNDAKEENENNNIKNSKKLLGLMSSLTSVLSKHAIKDKTNKLYENKESAKEKNYAEELNKLNYKLLFEYGELFFRERKNALNYYNNIEKMTNNSSNSKISLIKSEDMNNSSSIHNRINLRESLYSVKDDNSYSKLMKKNDIIYDTTNIVNANVLYFWYLKAQKLELADFLRTEKSVKKLELDDTVEEDEERKDRQPMSLSILLKKATEKKTITKDDTIVKRLIPNDKIRDYSELKKKLGNDLSRSSNVMNFRKSVSMVKLPVRKSFIVPKDKNVLVPKKSNLKVVNNKI